MKKQALLLSTLLGLAAACDVASGPPKATDSPGPVEAPLTSYRISVTRLLEYIEPGNGSRPPLPSWDDGLRRQLAADEATMYITGVRDAGEGRVWCVVASNVPPQEVVDAVIAELKKAPKQANAAAHVAAALARTFPCKKTNR